MKNKMAAPAIDITPVLPREFNDDNVALKNAWILKLSEEREISRVMEKLKKVLPNVPHLKRCNSGKLILGFAREVTMEKQDGGCEKEEQDGGREKREQDGGCEKEKQDGGHEKAKLVQEFSRQEIDDILRSTDLDPSIYRQENIYSFKVPQFPAKTKKQAEVASRIWPLNFRPDLRLESIIDGACFDPDNTADIQRCAETCADAYLTGSPTGNEVCDGSAIVFDPRTKNVVAIAVSKIDLHPMWHASLVAIDLVAQAAGGGAYHSFFQFDAPEGRIKYPKVQVANPPQLPLYFPPDLLPLARKLPYRPSSFLSKNSYLCTDFWIFLLREPCALCAMALLHSRISKIFYAIENSRYGVLGSKTLLHFLPGLNHRYGVWKNLNVEQCRAAYDFIQNQKS